MTPGIPTNATRVERAPTFQGIWLVPGSDFFAIKWLRKGRPVRNWSAARRRRMRRSDR